MKIARAKSKPSRAGGKENQNSIFALSVAILHNVMEHSNFFYHFRVKISFTFNILGKYVNKIKYKAFIFKAKI